ncbi:hypothetical protein [Streptomyces collinus]|uniref:Secreted protein n=2 Tax=Streptomyces collinus TaxID=42684 RepID=S5VJ00_STRC3|nr:hypothetical protein [Streptomyces collinus]AGS68385.1 hypothetical protein B446_07805 [Streptomyces collinus Tu 365]UJA07023.1 hypothetical protein HGI10_09100 [Streptomyces collinus]UJA18112.1 hypothetical protein HGI09_55010 [Streptomyces collinus]
MNMSGKLATGVVSLLSAATLTAGATTASASPAPSPVVTSKVSPADCGDWNRAVSLPGRWSTVNDGCGHFGRPGLKMGYTWAVYRGGSICVQVKGFVNGRKKWYNAGCGKTGSVKVPWGNVLAEKEMKVKGAALFNWK